VLLLLFFLTIRTYERRLEAVATTDSLTGISNRLAFEMEFDHTFGGKAAENGESSILLIDLDHFKRVNDTYDHLVGDQVIRHVTSIIGANIRQGDVFGRWGGEEFIVLLKDVGMDKAFVQAERLRLAVKESPYLHKGEPIVVTLSIGLASCRPGQGEEKHLFARADRALYRAKEAGRDRTERFGSV
jgi:diguanylate cyclase (GGDEF)-like protein